MFKRVPRPCTRVHIAQVKGFFRFVSACKATEDKCDRWELLISATSAYLYIPKPAARLSNENRGACMQPKDHRHFLCASVFDVVVCSWFDVRARAPALALRIVIYRMSFIFIIIFANFFFGLP